jgi:membrane-bound lytic murein transglycosylase MltF
MTFNLKGLSGPFQRLSAFLLVTLAAGAMLLVSCKGGREQQTTSKAGVPASAPDSTQAGSAASGDRWTGDLDGMLKRRQIRALVVYSRSAFFYDKGVPRGISYEALRELETTINKKYKTGALKVHVTFLPTPYDDLEKALVAGRGDMIAVGVIVTPERQKRVDFTVPITSSVKQIVVTNDNGPKLNSLDDLSGKTVYVNQFSVGYELLNQLNETFRKEGKQLINVEASDPNLGEEDLLEMANAGLIGITVSSNVRAEFWSKVFDHITLHPNLVLSTEGNLAWVFRKNSPQLKQLLDEFVATHGVGTSFGNTLLRRYLRDTKWVKNSKSEAEMKKFRTYVELFKKYGTEYNFDYLLLAAQSYQESGLNQDMRSHRGAVGLMQVMPKTAAANPINIPNISTPDANIRAGAKVMRSIRDTYFKGENIDPLNKTLLTFASYNAGPNRIARIRRKAAAEGLDPNKWFGNVELVVAKDVGQETVHYVGNIYKYYMAYKLALAQVQREQRAEEMLKKSR